MSSDGNGKYAATLTEVAAHFDVKERAAGRWMAEGAPGRGPDGYDLEAIRLWRGTHKEPARRGKRAQASGDEARLLRARAREREATAKLRELEVEIRSGKFIRHEVVKEHSLALISMTTRAIDAWARTLPPVLVALDERGIYAQLVKEIKALRTRMGRMCSLGPDADTTAQDGEVLQAEEGLDLASRFYEAAHGVPVPRLAFRGGPLGSGKEIVDAALARIRQLREGRHDGQG